MLDEALSFPRRDDSWRTVLTGGLLTFFGFLLLPLFVVSGYGVHVLRSSALGEAKAPPFDDWDELLVDGLKVFVIYLAYVFAPYMIVFVALLGMIFLIAQVMNGGGEAIVAPLFLLSFLVNFVLMFAVGYIIPVALTNFALEDRLSAAFEFGKIIDAATTGDYIKAVLFSILIMIVVQIVFTIVFSIIGLIIPFGFLFGIRLIAGGADPTMAGGLSIIVLIVLFLILLGLLAVFACVMFYVQMVTYYLLGQGCATTLVDDSSSIDGASPVDGASSID